MTLKYEYTIKLSKDTSALPRSFMKSEIFTYLHSIWIWLEHEVKDICNVDNSFEIITNIHAPDEEVWW